MHELRAALAGPLATLRQYNQFVIFRFEAVPGRTKLNKVPLNPHTLIAADKTDPANWLSADAAMSLATLYGAQVAPGGYGVGFYLSDLDPVWCLDLDECAGPDGWDPLVNDIVARFPGAAMEVSASRTGLHLWGVGEVPPHGVKRKIPSPSGRTIGMEMYSRGAFLALTGWNAQGTMADHNGAVGKLVSDFFPPRENAIVVGERLASGPVPEWSGPSDDKELIARALKSRSAAGAFGGKASFADLWHARPEPLGKLFPSGDDRPYDANAADLALASHLLFWTGNDTNRTIHLMRSSGLALARAADGKGKYERDDYLMRTVGAPPFPSRAVSSVYNDGKRPAAHAQGARPSPMAVAAVAPPVPLPPGVEVQVAPTDSSDLQREYQTVLHGCGTLGEIEAVCLAIKLDTRITPLVRETLRSVVRGAAKAVGADLTLTTCLRLMMPDRAVVETVEGDFDRDANSAIILSQTNVVRACRNGDFRYDEFTGHIITQARTLNDDDYTRAVVSCEAIPGFPPPPAHLVKSAIRLVASEHTYDSAQEWLGTLPAWDGTARIETLLMRVFQLPDSLYHRAVSRYMWTAMAGRALVPGIKADMVPVLMSEIEGKRKSTFCKELVPGREFFGILNMMGHNDDNISRSLLGKLVMEWEEMKGLKSRARETILAFMSRDAESWTPKYVEHEKTYARRCVIIGTTNERTMLPTYGTARRWLPVTIEAKGDIDLLIAERLQLWAEAAACFKSNGVEYQAAEHYAIGERGRYRVEDHLTVYIEQFLKATPKPEFGRPQPVPHGLAPFKLAFMKHWIMENSRSIRMINDSEAIEVLRDLGYDRRHGFDGKSWVKIAQ